MADVAQQVSEIATRIAVINSELEAHQMEIDSLNVKRIDLRKEREGLTLLLRSKEVEQRVATHESAAAAARADAEKAKATHEQLAIDLEAKSKQADELIAKLQAQAAAAETAKP